MAMNDKMSKRSAKMTHPEHRRYQVQQYRVIYHNRNNASGGHTLRAPGEVAAVQAKRAELVVTAANAHAMHALCIQLGVGGLATQIVLLLLAPVVDLTTGCTALVNGVTGEA